MTKSSEWIAVEKKYYAQTVRRQPVVIVRGEGTRVWDADGKEYLDFVAGWAVDNLGHCHPTVTQAIVEQADMWPTLLNSNLLPLQVLQSLDVCFPNDMIAERVSELEDHNWLGTRIFVE